MAMLAERRQRKRYHLVPRGKPLYEDDSRFGTKMLEKMGWSKGKGLGAKQEGVLDFVRVRYKNDAQGFGYELRDDQWTQHEDGFNGLLRTLNGEEDTTEKDDNKNTLEQSNNSEDDIPRMGFGFQDTSVEKNSKTKSDKSLKLKDKISGISLEEKSKQSKARVHYKKFTRGKDLSQYSEKDLANIFGKKIEDEQQTAINDFYQQLNNNTGVSINDYFKNKMENHQNANLDNNLEQEICTEDQQDETCKRDKKKKKEKKGEELEEENEKNNIDLQESNTKMFYSGVSVADYFKNKMEEMKKRQKINNNIENKIDQDISIGVQEDIAKKKKKNKHRNIDQEENIEENIIEEEKSKKKLKNLDDSQNEEKTKIPEDIKGLKQKSFEDISEEEPHKMKRRNEADISIEIQEDIPKKKKKNKKVKKDREESNEKDTIEEEQSKNLITVEVEENIKGKTKKTEDNKCLKQKKVYDDISAIDVTQEPEKKKRKKNKRKDASQDKETILKVANTSIEIANEIDLIREPEKKKKNKNKTLDDSSLEFIYDIDSNEVTQNEKNETLNALETTNVSDATQKIEIIRKSQPNPSKKNKKTKQELNNSGTRQDFNQIEKAISKDVSETSKNTKQKNLTNNKSLALDDPKNKYDSFNIYTISSFCAEKFRNLNVHYFVGSSLPQVNGYAISQDIKLDVVQIKNDEERITNLWKNTLDKYGQLEKPKKTYNDYRKEVCKSHKMKQKPPKLYVKTWKRKNAFQAI